MKEWLRGYEEGFSLVELLIVLALVGLVLSLGFTVYNLGVRMYSRGTDRATLQQEERYLLEFLPRELRFAYDVELFSSLDEDLILAENQTILYSDAKGVWQKQGTSDKRLILSADQVAYDIAFGHQAESGTLVIRYSVGLVKNNPPPDYKEVFVHLFNAELKDDGSVDEWAKVIKYSREP
jgi:prepilin-type N-terminal cleavage/methylation domain-containing protein